MEPTVSSLEKGLNDFSSVIIIAKQREAERSKEQVVFDIIISKEVAGLCRLSIGLSHK
jgi:hypothetical protein